MPYVDSSGVSIHYQVEGSGPPLVCGHGFTDSLDSFYEAGYVHGLKESYRLILMDARSHGKSDKLHDVSAHLVEKRVADVLAVMDAEGVSRAFFFGYSMEGTTGFALPYWHSERLLGVIIGGMHARSRHPEKMEIEARSRSFRQLGLEGVVAERERQGNPMPPGRRERFLTLDAKALSACSQALGEWDGIEEALPEMTTPALIFAGENDLSFHDAARGDAARMPNATFVSLPGVDHTEAFQQSDLVLPHIKEFLGKIRLSL